MATMKDANNPSITPGQQVDGQRYPQIVSAVQQQWDKVVSQQYQQAGIKRQQGK